jgi:hypothetical protein
VIGWRRPSIVAAAWLAGTGCAVAEVQPSNLQMEISGAGALAWGGSRNDVKTITYTTSSETKRTSFSVNLPDRTITFSGAQEGWTDPTHDVLTLDSVMVLARDGVKDLTASGACQMEISSDATFVRAVECTAATEQGPFALTFRLRG